MHGVAQFDIPTGQQKKGAPGQPTYTSYFSNTLCELARQVDVELIVETVLMCCVAVCCSVRVAVPQQWCRQICSIVSSLLRVLHSAELLFSCVVLRCGAGCVLTRLNSRARRMFSCAVL